MGLLLAEYVFAMLALSTNPTFPRIQILTSCTLHSVWTVDIAHLLRRFYLEVVFTTLTLGTNPGFAEESFYTQMHEDEVRVQRLFEVRRKADAEAVLLLQVLRPKSNEPMNK